MALSIFAQKSDRSYLAGISPSLAKHVVIEVKSFYNFKDNPRAANFSIVSSLCDDLMLS